ncbi:hypothetical protein HDE_04165 [Halotydeus destructor]|nr:hypothetical protein HDE_04165 [Halotydeus destructor]
MSNQGDNPNKNVNFLRRTNSLADDLSGLNFGPDHVGVQGPKNGGKDDSTVTSQSHLTAMSSINASSGDQGQVNVEKNNGRDEPNRGEKQREHDGFRFRPPTFTFGPQNSTQINNNETNQDNSFNLTRNDVTLMQENVTLANLTTMMNGMQEMMRQFSTAMNTMSIQGQERSFQIDQRLNQMASRMESSSSADASQGQQGASSQNQENGSQQQAVNNNNDSAIQIANAMRSFNSRMKLPVYDGSALFEKWLLKARMMLELNSVPRNEYITKIISAIKKPASKKLDDGLTTMANEGRSLQGMNPDYFITRLSAVMDNAVHGPVALKALRDMSQRINESAQDYMKRFSATAMKVRISDEDKMNTLIMGLKAKLSNHVLMKADSLIVENYESRIELAEQYLEHLAKRERQEEYEQKRLSNKNKSPTANKESKSKQVCYKCGEQGHYAPSCTKVKQGDKKKTMTDQVKKKETTVKHAENVVEQDTADVQQEEESGNDSSLSETSEEDEQ